MPLIKCPECNEEISNTVNQCIHCGCKITACPECEAVFAKELDSCPECGYVFKNQNKLENEKKDSNTDAFSTVKEAVEAWKRDINLRNLYFSKTIGLILFGLEALFIILSFLEFFNWFSLVNQTKDLTDSLKMLDLFLSISLSSEDTLKSFITFSVIAAFFGVIYHFWDTSKEAIYTADFGSWARKRSVNLENLIRKNLDMDFSKMTREEVKNQSKAIQMAINAEVYNKDLIAKNALINHNVIDNLMTLINNILYTILFASNFENYINKVLSQGGYVKLELSLIVNWWIIAVIVLIMIAEPFFTKSSQKKLASSRKQWVDKNMPEHNFKYEKYIIDPDFIE